MADDITPLHDAKFTDCLRELEQLLSQPHRAFLLGAGCSKCAGLPLTLELTDRVANEKDLSTETKAILEGIKTSFAGTDRSGVGRPMGTIEDYLSELVDHLSIAQRRKFCTATNHNVEIAKTSFNEEALVTALEQIKRAIVLAIDKDDVMIATHRSFVRAIHKGLQSGKSRDTHTVDYFVLNYDTLIEDALGFEKITLADGFSGGGTGWWDQNAFNLSGIVARVFKVHGSIDWRLMDDDVLPHRVRGIEKDSKDLGSRVLIWPAATKYRETQRDPYAQIFKFLRSALRPRDKLELALTICGYSFGDSHINLELDQALRESRQRLTIIAFTPDATPTGQLEAWLNDKSVRDQVRVYARNGFFHGTTAVTSTVELPWWKFEVLTRLLGGER
jgi:hypothetical protein